MPAYVIAHIDVKDPTRYEDYKRMSPMSIEIRRTVHRPRRPDGVSRRHVAAQADRVDRVSSVERAREWWASEDYAPAKALRQATSTGDLVLVEGL